MHWSVDTIRGDGAGRGRNSGHGVVIGPCILKTMGKFLDRNSFSGSPHDDPYGSSTNTCSEIKNSLHQFSPLAYFLPARMRSCGVAFDGRGIFAAGRGTTTLNVMDSVRFGRALGVGARAAAKSLVGAASAATSPNPRATSATQTRPVQSAATTPQRTASSRPAANQPVQQVARTAQQARRTTEGVARGGKRFGEAVWSPFVRLSGVLWLEFTGVFFGIFGLYALSGAWKLRENMHEKPGAHDAHIHFLMAAVMGVVFTYFCVSSFLRARRRERAR